MFDTTNFLCHWREDVICHNGRMCDGCEYQPAPEEKKNGKASPLPLEWEPDIIGCGMGWPICPACGEMPYSLERCVFCGQRFLPDAIVEEWSKPPEAVYEDCPACGGKGTLIGTRVRCNGHFHGHCTVCGCAVME